MKNIEEDDFDVIQDFEQGKLVTVKNFEQEKNIAKIAASNFLRKDGRINIRISSFDLNLLKRKAAEEGLPYQSLISSVLHKYVMGHGN